MAKVTKVTDQVQSNRDQNKAMSAHVQSVSDPLFVQDTLRSIYTKERFGSVKAAQIEAFTFLRPRVKHSLLTLRRVRHFFEGTAKIVRGEEKDAVRAAQIEEAKREYRELTNRLARLEAAFAVADAEFFGPQMDAHRRASAPVGGLDRPGTEG